MNSPIPFPGSKFQFELGSGEIVPVSEIYGLGTHYGILEYRQGNDKTDRLRKSPGLMRCSDIVIRRALTADRTLWNLFVSRQRFDGIISLLNELHEPVIRFRCRNAFIAGWEGPALSAASDEPAMETVHLAMEALEFDAG